MGLDDLGSRRLATLYTEGKCWAVRPELLLGLSTLHGEQVSAAGIEAARSSAKAGPSNVSGVSVVDLKGVITPDFDLMSFIFGGGGGLAMFLDDMRQAMADPETKAVVMNVDSPGGLVDGVPEAADQLRAMRDTNTKPIVAVANHTIASAAYWLASQANEVVASPSSEVGSVGVYQLHRDMSRALDQAGIKPTLIHAGQYKVEGNPYQPLDPEAFSAAQQAVDDYYGMFVDAVSQGRGVAPTPEDVTNGKAFGGGRMFTADRARKAGLADRVATLGDTVSRLASGRARVLRSTAEGDDNPVVAEEVEDPNPTWTWGPEERLRLLDVVASR
jgi:signal peptide peptidase SppA